MAEIVAEGLANGQTVVHEFDSQDEFSNWVRPTPHGNGALRLLGDMEDLQQHPERFGESERRRLDAKLNKIERDMDNLAQRTGLARGSMALFKRATIERPSHEPAIFDPGVFYDGQRGTGAWKFAAWQSPNLTWQGWNDRISSISVWGGAVLAEHSYYSGRRLWLFGFPGFVHNLPDYGFDNITSSFWFFGTSI